MTRKKTPTLTRRSILSALGAGFTASAIGTEAMAKQRTESQYVLVQGDTCMAVQPIRGRVPADEFYEYQLPEKYVSDANGATVGDTAMYASAGVQNLQRAQTSIAFLYQGPEGLSLVVVHGSMQASDGGAVTFRLSALPEDGEWIVKDDLYRNPDTGELADTNYDRWNSEGTEHRIDWTWGSSGTDGGVFRDLGDTFEVAVQPAFNEAAPLYNEYYEGTITDWQFLSGSGDDVARVSLDLDEPILIATGSCEDDTTPGKFRESTPKQEQEIEVEQEQEIKTEREEEEKDKKESEKEREEEKGEKEEDKKEREEEKGEKESKTKTEEESETEKETEEEAGEETDYETEGQEEAEREKEREEEEREEEKTDEKESEEMERDEKGGDEETERDDKDEDEETEKEKADEEREKSEEAREQAEEAREKANEGRGKGHDKGRGNGHGKDHE